MSLKDTHRNGLKINYRTMSILSMGFLSTLIVLTLIAIFVYLGKSRKRRAAKAERKRVEREKRLEQKRREYERKQMFYRIGNDFENYIIKMFDPSRFELIHRTPTNEDTDDRFVYSMIYPDLRFREISTGREFWVEVKYRSHTEDKGFITWCNNNQLRIYKKTRDKSGDPVFIMIGVGGSTQNPNRVYCLNLDRIQYTTLYYGTYVHNRVYVSTISNLDQMYAISMLKKS